MERLGKVQVQSFIMTSVFPVQVPRGTFSREHKLRSVLLLEGPAAETCASFRISYTVSV